MAKKSIEQKEYDKLSKQHAETAALYNKEQNFIQKNTLHLKLTKINGRMKELEGRLSKSTTSQRGNYASVVK